MTRTFGQLASETASYFYANPWSALSLVDDVVGSQNASLLMPVIAYSAARQERGERLPELAGGAANLAALPLLMWSSARVLQLIGIGTGPIGMAATFVGSIVLAQQPSDWIRHSVTRVARYLGQTDRRVRSLEFGGHYIDTQVNYAWRRNAVAEMNSTMQSARSYLGRESVLMHR